METVFLRHVILFRHMLDPGQIHYQVKDDSSLSLMKLILNCMNENVRTADMTAKIRGKFGWAATSLWGKVGRLAISLFTG